MATAESVEQAVYTVKDVATILDVSETTVERWVRDGILRSFKVENTRRIPRAAVEELLACGGATVGPSNAYGA